MANIYSFDFSTCDFFDLWDSGRPLLGPLDGAVNTAGATREQTRDSLIYEKE